MIPDVGVELELNFCSVFILRNRCIARSASAKRLMRILRPIVEPATDLVLMGGRVNSFIAGGIRAKPVRDDAGEHVRLWGVSRRELPNMIVIAHPESWVTPLGMNPAAFR